MTNERLSVARLDTPKARAFEEMDELRDQFAAYCEEQGFRGYQDQAERLIDLGAAFAFLVATTQGD